MKNFIKIKCIFVIGEGITELFMKIKNKRNLK